jgi:hypothetical protein
MGVGQYKKERKVTAPERVSISVNCSTFAKLIGTVCTELSPRSGTLVFLTFIPDTS